jgi:catechol 2,3-dioxygenase-like lactoylglutathione lyase family enzyme
MTGESLKDVTPVFAVSDVDATASWYRDVLGFEFDTFPETPPSEFAILSREGVEIFLQRVAGYENPDLSARREGGVWNAYIQVTGLQSLWGRIASLPGARGPEDRWYGQREIEVRDPNGYVLVFAEQATMAEP